jgi:hypothetical protein
MKIKLVHTFNKNDWFSFQPTDQKPLEIQHFIKGIIIKQWSSFWPCMCMCLTLCKVTTRIYMVWLSKIVETTVDQLRIIEEEMKLKCSTDVDLK